MPDFTRDPCRFLRFPAEGMSSAPGEQPASPVGNVSGTNPSAVAPQGQCIAEMAIAAINGVASHLGDIAASAGRGSITGGASGAAKSAGAEAFDQAATGVKDAYNSENCVEAREQNADRANSLGIGAIGGA